MNKSIYSLVLSDDVVDAVDALARTEGMSRSAMINRILAERVAYTTPEMRLRDILQSLARSMNGEFMLADRKIFGRDLFRKRQARGRAPRIIPDAECAAYCRSYGIFPLLGGIGAEVYRGQIIQ